MTRAGTTSELEAQHRPVRAGLRLPDRAWRARSVLLACVLVVAAHAVAAPGAMASAGRDELAPKLLKLQPVPSGERVRLRLEVVDPSGAGSVTARVMGPHEDDFRSVAMHRAAGDVWEVAVPRPAGDEPWIAYYFEATDAAGNGPATNGSRASPFIERFRGDALAPAASSLPRVRSLALVAVPLALLLGLFAVHGRGDRARQRQFWIELLAPVSDLEGHELAVAIERLCQRGHYHPVRGDVRVTPQEVRRQLATLNATHGKALAEARRRSAVRQAAVVQAPRARGAEQVAEDLFWFHALVGLVDLTGPPLDAALHALAARSLPHPALGRRYFDVPALRAKLDHVRRLDPAKLFAEAAALPEPPMNPASEPPTVRGARGASLIELLVALALLGLVVATAVVSLQPIAGPVQRAGDELDALMRQARARAMAGTTVHRVRPLDVRSFVVESARSCSSAAWSLEERLDLVLADGVSLSDTNWSVCFDGRGLASDNFMITLLHAERPPVQLELLRGGLVRWHS